MSPSPDGSRRFELRPELGRLAALLGVTGLAVAQPVLHAFGESPETFIFRTVEGAGVLRFGLLITFVPPLVVWLGGVAVGLVQPRLRGPVHALSIGAFIAL